MRKIQKIKGSKDYFAKECLFIRWTEAKFQKIAKKFNYQEVIFPVMERSELFEETIGKDTDIVNKEMYSFFDRKNRKLVLRPEGTASVARLILENKLLNSTRNLRFYYFQKMFRYERPQKGRQREFFQFGIENYNDSSIDNEIEIIIFATQLLKEFKIEKYRLVINSLGSIETRKRYRENLASYLQKNQEALSNDSKKRLKTNVLRILDSKDENDQKILKSAPKINHFWTETERAKYQQFKEYLTINKITFIDEPLLVRGLDYYNDLVFEFISEDQEQLGAKATIIAGGRYDNLLNKFDKKLNVSAIGFAVGVERFILAAASYFSDLSVEKLDYFICLLDINQQKYLHQVANHFRNLGSVYVNYNYDQKLVKNLQLALKNNASFLVIIDQQIENGVVEVKDLTSKKQEKVLIF